MWIQQNRLSTALEYWPQTSPIFCQKSFVGNCPQTRQSIVFRGCSLIVAWMPYRELWTTCPFQLHCMESLTCRVGPSTLQTTPFSHPHHYNYFQIFDSVVPASTKRGYRHKTDNPSRSSFKRSLGQSIRFTIKSDNNYRQFDDLNLELSVLFIISGNTSNLLEVSFQSCSGQSGVRYHYIRQFPLCYRQVVNIITCDKRLLFCFVFVTVFLSEKKICIQG